MNYPAVITIQMTVREIKGVWYAFCTGRHEMKHETCRIVNDETKRFSRNEAKFWFCFAEYIVHNYWFSYFCEKLEKVTYSRFHLSKTCKSTKTPFRYNMGRIRNNTSSKWIKLDDDLWKVSHIIYIIMCTGIFISEPIRGFTKWIQLFRKLFYFVKRGNLLSATRFWIIYWMSFKLGIPKAFLKVRKEGRSIKGGS